MTSEPDLNIVSSRVELAVLAPDVVTAEEHGARQRAQLHAEGAQLAVRSAREQGL